MGNVPVGGPTGAVFEEDEVVAEDHDTRVWDPTEEPDAPYDIDAYTSDEEDAIEGQHPEFAEGENVWECNLGAWYAVCSRFSPIWTMVCGLGDIKSHKMVKLFCILKASDVWPPP